MQKAIFKLAALPLMLLVCAIPFVAQKSKTKAAADRPMTQDPSQMPEIKDFAYVIERDQNSNITVRIQTSEDVEFISNTADAKPLGKFFSGAAKGKTFSPIIIVRPGEPAYWGDLVDVLKEVRNNSALPMKMETAPALYAFVPQPPDPKKPLPPNPLFLMARLAKDGKLQLNSGDQGNISDLTRLRNSLEHIFKDREANGVFRAGSNEVEKTVSVRAEPGAKFADVMKLIDEIRDAGADRIGIDLDL